MVLFIVGIFAFTFSLMGFMLFLGLWTYKDAQAKSVQPPVLWVLLVLVMPVIGFIVYLLAGRTKNDVPAPGNFSGTLVNALMHHCKDLSGVNGVLRPGIVHRLDKDTSGLIVVAKHDKAHNGLAAQLAERNCERVYWAIVRGVLAKDSMTIKTNIGRHSKDRKKMAVVPADKGKEAITHIQVLERFKSNTLVEAKLETGRTHQIRVHMFHIGHPVVGDPVYGAKKDGRQFLHAKILGFRHPITGDGMRFEVELPEYFLNELARY